MHLHNKGCLALVCMFSQNEVLVPFLPFLPVLFRGGLLLYFSCLAYSDCLYLFPFNFLSQRHNNKLYHFISGIMDYLGAGEDQQQTNQPNDQAGGCTLTCNLLCKFGVGDLTTPSAGWLVFIHKHPPPADGLQTGRACSQVYALLGWQENFPPLRLTFNWLELVALCSTAHQLSAP